MRQITASTCIAATALASTASADLVGGGVVSLQSWNDAASATLGRNVSVFRLYLAFDSPGDWNNVTGSDQNVLFNVFNANIATASALNQDAAGGDTPQSDTGISLIPSLEWDSWVTIGTDRAASGLATDPNFQWTANGVTNNSGWFNSNPPNNLGAAILDTQFGTGLSLVTLAQFVLEQPSGGSIFDIRSDGEVGTGGIFAGEFSVTVGRGVADQPTFTGQLRFAEIPAPGGVAVLGLGLVGAAIRRRR